MAAPCPPFSDTANLQTSDKQTAPPPTLTLAAPHAHPRGSRRTMDIDQQQLKKLIGAFWNQAPLAQIDPLATPSVLRIADADGKPPLWYALVYHVNPEVVRLVIRRLLEALPPL